MQIWVPDIAAPDFAAEAARQGALVAASYQDADRELSEFWDRIFAEDDAGC